MRLIDCPRRGENPKPASVEKPRLWRAAWKIFYATLTLYDTLTFDDKLYDASCFVSLGWNVEADTENYSRRP